MKTVKIFVHKVLNALGYVLENSQKQEKLNYLWIENFNIKTVLDIGANEGQFALALNKHVKDLAIISFEPLLDTFEKLKLNTTEFKNISCHNFALGDKNEMATIHKNVHSPSSSLLALSDIHKKSYPEFERATEENIKIKRLDDVVQKLSLDLSKDFLIKIDVQGFEDKVIEGGKETLQKAKIIIVEIGFVELYEHQPLFDTIYKKLTGMGFKFKGVLNTAVDKNSGLPLFTDGIFIQEHNG